MLFFCFFAVTAAAARVAIRRDHAVSSFKLSTVLVATWPASTSCAVSVTGLSQGTPVEPIRWFFENTKRSGGGPLVVLCYNDEDASAVVTFHNRNG